MTRAAKIAALARRCGIIPEYLDNARRRRRTSPATQKALLNAMGVDWEEPARLEEELARRRLGPFRALVGPVQVILPESGRPRAAVFPWLPSPQVPPQVEVQGEVTDEAGRRVAWEGPARIPSLLKLREVEDGFRARLEVLLPPGLGMGYYDLSLRIKAGKREEAGRTRLIIAPRQAYLPPFLSGGRRLWGFNLPLYALRSERNWGMGDFGDLGDMLAWAADLGASFVGVNPLHAATPAAQADSSPYSPTSRLFLNFLYLNLEEVPELAHCPEAQALLNRADFQSQKARLQARDLVPYSEVCRLKRQVLKLLFAAFFEVHGPPENPRTPRGEEFARFLKDKGELLVRFGRFAALADRLREGDWRAWPEAYRHPENPEVIRFAAEHSSQVCFHQYCQWLAAAQLAGVCVEARNLGLPFTLYQDLALGATPGGFDTWARPELFARGAAIGAPPDAFNPKGQNWGLPPLIPERLRQSSYQLFIETLRANLPPDGMLRLDHIMGLFRLYWIPPGADPAQGAYVRYPARELLAILALESARSRTLIIGEDLGTVSPAILRELARARTFSYRVFYFERGWNGEFRRPEAYPRAAVAAVTTHDLPTLAGFWQGRDLELKRTLRLYPQDHQAREDEIARDQDRGRLVEALKHRGLLPEDFSAREIAGEPCPEEVRVGVLEYLAQSDAALMEVRLEDIYGWPEQQNLPGTRDEHPNWRRKMGLSLSRMRQAPEAARLAARLNKYRGRGGRQSDDTI